MIDYLSWGFLFLEASESTVIVFLFGLDRFCVAFSIQKKKNKIAGETHVTDMEKKLEEYGLADGVSLNYDYVFGLQYGCEKVEPTAD